MNFLNKFLQGTFWEKYFILKGKTLFTNKRFAKIKYRQPKIKTKSQSKIFSLINKTNKGEGRDQSSWFSDGL